MNGPSDEQQLMQDAAMQERRLIVEYLRDYARGTAWGYSKQPPDSKAADRLATQIEQGAHYQGSQAPREDDAQ